MTPAGHVKNCLENFPISIRDESEHRVKQIRVTENLTRAKRFFNDGVWHGGETKDDKKKKKNEST